jgi:hypothetical protein
MARFGFRFVVLLCLFVAMAYSATALDAAPLVHDGCCSSPGDCGSGEKCCPSGSLGLPDCGEGASGWCTIGACPALSRR